MIEEAKKRFEEKYGWLLNGSEIKEGSAHARSLWTDIEKELLLAKEEGRQEVLKAIPKKKRKGLVWIVLGHNNCIDQIHKEYLKLKNIK